MLKNKFIKSLIVILWLVIIVMGYYTILGWNKYFKQEAALKKENIEYRKVIKNGDSVRVYFLPNDSTPNRTYNIKECKVDSILNDSTIKISMVVKKIDLYKK